MLLSLTSPTSPTSTQHFDVKPDNLLVDGDWLSERGPVVKVVSATAGCACLSAAKASFLAAGQSTAPVARCGRYKWIVWD